MSTRYVVVMAGGSGTRFWPKSRSAYPKQFLSIGGERSLLRQTVDRVITGVGKEQVFVVTGAAHAAHALRDLPDLPPGNILIEPTGRNTAPCIGWATEAILARDRTARIAVLASDHHISDPARFMDHLEAAFEAASDRIILFGIVPTRPETGYGYIRRGAKIGEARGMDVCLVERFVEKPDRGTALKYIEEGRYLWNSGMFVFSAEVMSAEITRLLPDLSAGLRAMRARPDDVGEIYPKLPSISIDYAVMERTDRVAVLPASFGWSDVGSWDAAMELHRPDTEGNVLEGDAVVVGVHRSMIDARAGRMVAVVGVDDVIVVDTEDAVLVIRRGASQEVKSVVEALKATNRKNLL